MSVASICCTNGGAKLAAGAARQVSDSNPEVTQTVRDGVFEAADSTAQDENHQEINPRAVYFGWVRNAGTRLWREVVKSFSQNRTEYPSWSDEIGQKVLTVLREEKGIDEFFISRRRESNSESKKLFDKQKNPLNPWSVATPQEVLERTKQRFIDDRKQQAKLSGAKRPRGDQFTDADNIPLLMQRLSAACMKVLEGTEIKNILVQLLYKELVKDPKNKDILDWLALAVHHNQARKSGGDAAATAALVEPSTPWFPVMPNELCFAWIPSSSTIQAQERELRLPILKTDVCFGWANHQGTAKWRSAVNALSDDAKLHPDWTDTIAHDVKQKLADAGYDVFLVSLDIEGNPSNSPADGLWYRASNEEFVENTKQQFIANRIHL